MLHEVQYMQRRSKGEKKKTHVQPYCSPPYLERDGEAIPVRHEVFADAESVDRRHHG